MKRTLAPEALYDSDIAAAHFGFRAFPRRDMHEYPGSFVPYFGAALKMTEDFKRNDLDGTKVAELLKMIVSQR